MRVFNLFLISILLFSFLILPVLAQSPVKGLNDAAPESIKTHSSLPEIAGAVILCLILYAGYTWLTAEGEPDKVKKAKNMITNSIIGLIIVLASYSIALFVVEALNK